MISTRCCKGSLEIQIHTDVIAADVSAAHFPSQGCSDLKMSLNKWVIIAAWHVGVSQAQTSARWSNLHRCMWCWRLTAPSLLWENPQPVFVVQDTFVGLTKAHGMWGMTDWQLKYLGEEMLTTSLCDGRTGSEIVEHFTLPWSKGN